MSSHSQVLIIGSGPAGYTAAIYAARAMLRPRLIEGMNPGGQLSITTDVENYPGFAQGVQGPSLMESMRAQAEHVGAEIVTDHVSMVDLDQRPFRLECESGDSYTCDTLIICTGAQARWLGLESEAQFRGYGVSACATCDGFFYRNKEVIVVGGGNTAVEEAIFLTSFAKRVTLVHRGHSLRAERVMQERLFKNDKIDILWDSEIAEIVGAEGPKRVTGVRIRNLKTSAVSEKVVDGVFVAIGHAPATELFRSQLELKDSGYIITKPDSTATTIPGVFAAGDVKDDAFRQAITAAGTGCMAALEAERWIASSGLSLTH